MQTVKLPWFRFYAESVDDAKLRLLAYEDRWHFVALLCCKAQGILDIESSNQMIRRRVAVKLGVQAVELDEIVRRLAEVGLISKKNLQPTGWEARQFSSDQSLERVRKYRKNKEACNVTEALPKRYDDVTVTPPVSGFVTDAEVGIFSEKNTQILGSEMQHAASDQSSKHARKSLKNKEACNVTEALPKRYNGVTVTPPDTDTELREELCSSLSSAKPDISVGVREMDCSVFSNPSGNAKSEADKKKAARGTRLPEDWILPDDWVDWARRERPTWALEQIDTQAEIFRDHWWAQPGAKGRKADWYATWRNWVRKSFEQRGGNNGTRREILKPSVAERATEARKDFERLANRPTIDGELVGEIKPPLPA